MSDRPVMPQLLIDLHQIPIEYLDGDGIDFEPFQLFRSAVDTTEWIRAWTGNETLDGSEYLIFGQDGTGGYAAFWLTRRGVALLDQPIVFFDSEGDLGVIAADFADYLWLLAAGVGPYEALAYGADLRPGNERFRSFALTHASTAEKTAKAALARAQAEFPGFVAAIRALCR